MKDKIKKAGIVLAGGAVMTASLAANTAYCEKITKFKTNEDLSVFLQETNKLVKEKGGTITFKDMNCIDEALVQVKKEISDKINTSTKTNKKVKPKLNNIKVNTNTKKNKKVKSALNNIKTKKELILK